MPWSRNNQTRTNDILDALDNDVIKDTVLDAIGKAEAIAHFGIEEKEEE